MTTTVSNHTHNTNNHNNHRGKRKVGISRRRVFFFSSFSTYFDCLCSNNILLLLRTRQITLTSNH